MRSVPTNMDATTWRKELEAPEELARRGYASKLLFLLREKLQLEQEAISAGTSRMKIDREISAIISGGGIQSAPREFQAGDWHDESEAAKELAQQGLASNLLFLLKEKLQQNQVAASRAQASGVKEYVPIPIGTSQQNRGATSYAQTSETREYVPAPIVTPPIPPMPKGIPIRGHLYPSTTAPGGAIPSLAPPGPGMIMDQYNPLKSTLVSTNSLVNTTAPMKFGAKTTSTYTRPITVTGVKRRYDTMSSTAVAAATRTNIYNTTSGQQLYCQGSNTRSLFAASLVRRGRCVGPALGVPVGKISVNPLMAPQNELQGELFEAIMTGKYKIGLLKTTDGKIIMRKKWCCSRIV
ncbi:hypothetical protein QAD02_013537 [Eretmocerus hayati]|uniref:Uncharacterized protein n=1 Tax=Eretmocerus hayati TaxID=131215 RepID=A0ACC2P2X6_9HYME|nr:hypothetical protein QAD02_013537 [Eretmocerus hayati]